MEFEGFSGEWTQTNKPFVWFVMAGFIVLGVFSYLSYKELKKLNQQQQ